MLSAGYTDEPPGQGPAWPCNQAAMYTLVVHDTIPGIAIHIPCGRPGSLQGTAHQPYPVALSYVQECRGEGTWMEQHLFLITES